MPSSPSLPPIFPGRSSTFRGGDPFPPPPTSSSTPPQQAAAPHAPSGELGRITRAHHSSYLDLLPQAASSTVGEPALPAERLTDNDDGPALRAHGRPRAALADDRAYEGGGGEWEEGREGGGDGEGPSMDR